MNAYKRLLSFGNLKTANEVYTSIIVNSLNQMFEYKGMPEDFNIIRFENILLSTGRATFETWNNKLVPAYVDGAGKRLPDDTYEINYTRYINGSEIFERPSDYPVCYNTGDRQPALNILRFADMLSEVDLSMVFNLQRSRLAPIPVAKNRAMRDQLKNIFEAVKNGNYEAISADIDRDLLSESNQAVEMINLNDPKAIEYMNYLSELHDALTRRIYTMYGMAVQETSKHAQVNKDESNARDGVSWLIPDNMLNERKKFLKEWNKQNGTDFSVDYSELFKKEREIMEEKNNDDSRTSDAADNSGSTSSNSDSGNNPDDTGGDN